MNITKQMFDSLIVPAREYMKRLELFWEKQIPYRKRKVHDAADMLTAQYIIYGGSDEASVFKATSLACTMKEANYDYDKTVCMLRDIPQF